MNARPLISFLLMLPSAALWAQPGITVTPQTTGGNLVAPVMTTPGGTGTTNTGTDLTLPDSTMTGPVITPDLGAGMRPGSGGVSQPETGLITPNQTVISPTGRLQVQPRIEPETPAGRNATRGPDGDIAGSAVQNVEAPPPGAGGRPRVPVGQAGTSVANPQDLKITYQVEDLKKKAEKKGDGNKSGFLNRLFGEREGDAGAAALPGGQGEEVSRQAAREASAEALVLEMRASSQKHFIDAHEAMASLYENRHADALGGPAKFTNLPSGSYKTEAALPGLLLRAMKDAPDQVQRERVQALSEFLVTRDQAPQRLFAAIQQAVADGQPVPGFLPSGIVDWVLALRGDYDGKTRAQVNESLRALRPGNSGLDRSAGKSLLQAELRLTPDGRSLEVARKASGGLLLIPADFVLNAAVDPNLLSMVTAFEATLELGRSLSAVPMEDRFQIAPRAGPWALLAYHRRSGRSLPKSSALTLADFWLQSRQYMAGEVSSFEAALERLARFLHLLPAPFALSPDSLGAVRALPAVSAPGLSAPRGLDGSGYHFVITP